MSSKGLPHFASGMVISGFGRGSKDLGIPTANYPEQVVNSLPSELETGVYYGWANVNNGPVYKMVMSIGWNPFFKNVKKSMETHIMHEFSEDFYGEVMNICILGFIRPELDFKNLDDLIATIKLDITLADGALDSPTVTEFRSHPFFGSHVENGLKHLDTR